MPTNVSEHKRIEHSASQDYLAPDKVTVVEEKEEFEVTAAHPANTPTGAPDSAAVDVAPEQKIPHFYERKIRVRKYDFL